MQTVAHHASAVELVQRFLQLRVLVIGDLMVDTYLEGIATRLCSEGPIPVVQKTSEQYFPGGAANTAVNLQALHAQVMLLGVVGHDKTGSVLRASLQQAGVADQWLVEDVSVATLHKLRILANGHYVVRYDEGGLQGQTWTPACERQLFHHLDELYPQCDLVVVSDYGYGVFFSAFVERLQTLHAANPKPLLIDSKTLQRFRNVPATIVTPNYQEAMLFLEGQHSWPHGTSSAVDPMNLQAIEQNARQVLAALCAESIAVTLAQYGAFFVDRKGQSLHIPAYPVAHAHDIGAGDSFSAALALALGAGSDPVEAVRIGIDAAGIAVSRPRTAVVLHQELLQRVSLRIFTTEQKKSHMQPNRRLENMQRLAAVLAAEKKQGRTIVFTNGIFDILHAGHVQFLRQAKALGDVLVVGINSDTSVGLCRGPGRIINNEQDRYALVAALGMVDHVLLFDEETPILPIHCLRPNIHVKGGDYAECYLPEEKAVQHIGGKLVILPLVGTLTTNDFMEHVISCVASGGVLEKSFWGDIW